MKRNAFLMLLIIGVCLAAYAKQKAKVFTLSEIPLSWNQFTPATKMNGIQTAGIYIYTTYDWSSITNSGGTIVDFTSKLEVIKEKSLVKDSFINAANAKAKQDLLNHEKGHLVIMLIKNIWVRDSLSNRSFAKNYKQQMREVYKYFELKADSLSNAYDDATMHSLIKDKQLDWEIQLMNQFNQLNKGNSELPIQFNFKFEIQK